MKDPVLGGEKSKPTSTIEVVAEQKKESVKVARQRLKPGQTMFELNLEDNSIRKAEIETSSISFEKNHFNVREKVHKVVTKPNCWYVPALNFRNARRKFIEMGKGIGLVMPESFFIDRTNSKRG